MYEWPRLCKGFLRWYEVALVMYPASSCGPVTAGEDFYNPTWRRSVLAYRSSLRYDEEM